MLCLYFGYGFVQTQGDWSRTCLGKVGLRKTKGLWQKILRYRLACVKRIPYNSWLQSVRHGERIYGVWREVGLCWGVSRPTGVSKLDDPGPLEARDVGRLFPGWWSFSLTSRIVFRNCRIFCSRGLWLRGIGGRILGFLLIWFLRGFLGIRDVYCLFPPYRFLGLTKSPWFVLCVG